MDDGQTLVVALDWARQGRKVALATVVETRGSAPRPAGARLAVDDSGRFCGSVSSGCVETEIIAAAEEVIATREPVLRAFGPGDGGPLAPSLTCGGVIRIFVEFLADPQGLQDRLDRARSGAASASLLDLGTGERTEAKAIAHVLDGPGRRRLGTALRADENTLIETPQGAFFLEVWRPPLRLAIVGAVHIAQTLAPLCALAGYEVTVIDPRPAFAGPERFPGQIVVTLAPEDYFAQNPPDARTAIVALSHEARFDDPALVAALQGGAFYVGALGSRASAEKRRQRLRARGLDEAALARLRGPVGLAIGARTPAEIAIAIAAEMTRALRQSARAAFEAAAE
jgi:xanthine dehydrogenase accessory factor